MQWHLPAESWWRPTKYISDRRWLLVVLLCGCGMCEKKKKSRGGVWCRWLFSSCKILCWVKLLTTDHKALNTSALPTPFLPDFFMIKGTCFSRLSLSFSFSGTFPSYVCHHNLLIPFNVTLSSSLPPPSFYLHLLFVSSSPCLHLYQPSGFEFHLVVFLSAPFFPLPSSVS